MVAATITVAGVQSAATGVAAPRTALHPRNALFEADGLPPLLPVCAHYAGTDARMRKALALQAAQGSMFDVTLDCEDGAALGDELAHAGLIATLLQDDALNRHGRVGVRLHPVHHPAFRSTLALLVEQAGHRLAYAMVPKSRHLQDAEQAIGEIDHTLRTVGRSRPPPVHALIETHGGLADVQRIAALPRIESLSFGLMDFVSAHRGAIPAAGMGAEGQFTHPLVLRAKLEIAAACHAHGKTPSHCVVTEFTDMDALATAARTAAESLGYTRMWSIHPNQIPTIVAAFAPSPGETQTAAEILLAAQDAHWAPTRHGATLHDRASYRHHWMVLARAARSGRPLPEAARQRFFA